MLTSFTADRFEVCTPNSPIFRLGRLPSPWQPPEWFWASEDGTFGNRFDDPSGYYRVPYASSQRLSCFIETLAQFRPDIALVAELSEIEGENDHVPIGVVPGNWLSSRSMGKARLSGSYADIHAKKWLSSLRIELVNDALRLCLKDVDASVLQQAAPRILTQRASRYIYERGFDGVFYRSRYGHDLENWALFEAFKFNETQSEPVLSPRLPSSTQLFS